MVLDPVMPNTVHINSISLYQAAVCRSGIGLGPRKRCHIVVVSGLLPETSTPGSTLDFSMVGPAVDSTASAVVEVLEPLPLLEALALSEVNLRSLVARRRR
jgi:hypothetical protein